MFRNGCLVTRTGSTIGTLAIATLLLAGCSAGGDTVVSGTFGPDKPITLKNLTVQDGRYLVSYALDVFVTSPAGEITLTCSVVDTTGRLAELPGLAQTAASGGWQEISAKDVFELPDLTMGIRCYPDREVSMQVVVRDARLGATRID